MFSQMEMEFSSLHSSRLSLAWAYERFFPEETRYFASASNPFRLWKLEKGAARFRLREQDAEELEVTLAVWFIAPPRYAEQRIAAGSRIVSLGLEWMDDAGQRPLLALKTGALPPAAQQTVKEASSRVLNWVKARGTTAYQKGIEAVSEGEFADLQGRLWALTHVLLREAERGENALGGRSPSDRPSDPRMVQIMTVLRAHAAQVFPDCTVLEELVGLSWRRITQIFQQQTGKTPHVWHDELRLEEARRRLFRPAHSVKEIAHTLGFPSVSAFSQWFKARQGCGPQEFRHYAVSESAGKV